MSPESRAAALVSGTSPSDAAAGSAKNSLRVSAKHCIGRDIVVSEASIDASDSDMPEVHDIPTFAASDAPVSFLDLVVSILHMSEAVHVGLRDFIKSSVVPQSRTVHRPVTGHDIMPCPIPCWKRWTGSSPLSPRRRRRRKFLETRAKLLQRVIAVLNWETLGHPTIAPPEACMGYPFSDQQWDVVCRLERLVDHHLRAGPVSADSLGRSGEKFSQVLRAAQELPSVREVDLHELVQEIAQGLDPYSSNKGDCVNHEDQFTAPRNTCKPDKAPHNPLGSDCPKQATTQIAASPAKPVVASRIKWERSPQFDPTPFLQDDIVRTAFLDPTSVRLPQESWPSKPRGRVHCSKSELLALASKWDAKGALRIFRLSDVDFEECVGMFAVPKDCSYDRLILNPQVVNSRMMAFSHYTKELAPGSMFTMIRLEHDQFLRLSADDLAEMYYTIKVPLARAKRNCIGKVFSPDELAHFSCFNAEVHTGPCLLALSALAMGDSWAVEFAQQSHHNVLRVLAGCMLDHERVCYRKPFPRSLFFEFLSIDDHIGAQIVTYEQLTTNVPLRDTEVFVNSEKAYSQVKLVQHPRKRQRNVTEGIFSGAEIDGVAGLVSAPRHRISVLMLCTCIIAKQGTCSPRLLACILGCWIHVLMFRRPVLAVLSHAFSEGKGLPQNEIFALSRETRNELLALCLLGPVCVADLRVGLAPYIYCTDASPDGAGICRSSEEPAVVGELWRHSEQRGYYTQLLTPAAEILAGLDEPFHDQTIPDVCSPDPEISVRIPSSLSEGVLFDCIELFRGEGNWSDAHAGLGFKVHSGLDISGNGFQFNDLLDDSVFHQVVSLAARGVIEDWHAGPSCKTYGTLRRPRIRSKRWPAGFNLKDPLTRGHTLLALRTAFILNLVWSTGRFFSVEQPGSSVMFHLDIFQRMVFRGCMITKMCFCAFGSPFMKPSKWLHNKPWMIELERPCQCESRQSHFIIEGNFTASSIAQFDSMCQPSAVEVYGRLPRVGEQVSSYSASYPKALCRRIAAGAMQARKDTVPVVPLSVRIRSLQRIGHSIPGLASVAQTPMAEPRPFHEDPEWVEELADSVAFKELLRYRFRRLGHINVLECRVHKTLMKHCAKHHPDSRFITLLDSRVTLGATSKGRSSSRALCRVLQGSLGYIIGGGLYPGGLHICSSKNRSDAPSRNRPVPPPSKEEPRWLTDLCAGSTERFDRVLAAARYTKLAGRWLRFLLLLCGDIEPNPGPQPRRQKPGHYEPRGPLDLLIGFAPATASRMSACLKSFQAWLMADLNLDLESIAWDQMAAPLALRAYGMHLFSTGAPRYKFVYTITAIQDAFPHLRPFLSPAWHVDKKWQQHEPGCCRPVLSASVVKAMTTLCLIWQWYRWLGVTLIGFLGMLHPAEFVQLRRSDLLLPEDSLSAQRVFFVHLRHPKTARFARRQHCKIDDPVVLAYVEKVFGPLAPNEQLFIGGASAYRRRWDHVLSKLQVPVSMEVFGATPAVLRGSGATYLYMQTEDLNLVQWRGRWAQLKTVEH